MFDGDDRLLALYRRWAELVWPVKVAWKRVRGLTGDFSTAEDSERARQLTVAWERAWPGTIPVGHSLRSQWADRWVRFHSLPDAKRYADSHAEYEEISRRHFAVLAALAAIPCEQLLVIGEDYGPRDVHTGWTRRHLPGAWPWRRQCYEGEACAYYWVKSGLSRAELAALLRATADDETSLIIAPPGLGWVYHPYDGGADVIAADRIERDALQAKFSEWLSGRADGL